MSRTSLSPAPRLIGRGAGICIAALCLSSTVSAADGGARILLLPAGPRASVVVELDDETPKATAIEATDSQSVDVEIGPVHGKVANQLLEAAQDSGLVHQVRVGGITQGVDGTVITIHITAKGPVSGSVRRAQRRIYVDLQPLDARGAGPRAADRVAANTPPQPTRTTGTVNGSATTPVPAGPKPVAPAPAAAPAHAVTPPAAPLKAPPPAAAPVRAAAKPPTAAPAAVAVPPQEAPRSLAQVPVPAAAPPVPNPALAQPAAGNPVLPKPSTAVGSYSPVAPMTSTPTRPVATPGPAPNGLDDVQRRAEQLAKVPDVKGLERLKVDLQYRRTGAIAVGTSTSEIDALLTRIDLYVVEAQRNQLAADASLFKSATGAGGNGTPAEFQQAIRPLKPELESVSNALRGWSGGSLPPANLQTVIASLLPRLRSLKPPSTIQSAHSGMCDALDALALMWAKASVEPPPEGTETAVIDRASQAVDAFLRIERTFGPPASAAR